MVGFSSSSPRKKTRRPLKSGARRQKSKRRRNPETASVAVPAAVLSFHGRLPPPSTSHEGVRRAGVEGSGDSKSLSSSSNGLDSSSFLGGDGKKISSDEFCGFVDEEVIFNLPLVVDSMAEGMFLTPPALKKGFSWRQGTDDIEIGYTLWTE